MSNKKRTSRTPRAGNKPLPVASAAEDAAKKRDELLREHMWKVRDGLISAAATVGLDVIQGTDCRTAGELCVVFHRLNEMSLELLETTIDSIDVGATP